MRFAGTYKGRHLKRIVSLVEAYLARLIWWNVSVGLKIIIFNEMWIITNIKSIFNFPSTLNWELFTLKLVPSIGSPPPFILWLIVIKPSMTSILFQLQIRTKFILISRNLIDVFQIRLWNGIYFDVTNLFLIRLQDYVPSNHEQV